MVILGLLTLPSILALVIPTSTTSLISTSRTFGRASAPQSFFGKKKKPSFDTCVQCDHLGTRPQMCGRIRCGCVLRFDLAGCAHRFDELEVALREYLQEAPAGSSISYLVRCTLHPWQTPHDFGRPR